MKRLQRCCCCASTRTGTLITSVLGILLSIATIVMVWLVPKHLVSFSTFFSDDVDRKLADLDIPRIILTINLCFTILISLLLYVAVMKRRSWMMLPWVVLGIVLAIGMLISVLHTSITYYLNKGPRRLSGERDENGQLKDPENDDHIWIATIILVGGLIYLCFYLYLWAVVFSHYLDVRDEEERGRYRKAPYRR